MTARRISFDRRPADKAAPRRTPLSTPPVTGKVSTGVSTDVSTDVSTGGKFSPEALQLARAHVATFAAPHDARSAWVVSVTLLLWVGMQFLGKVLFSHGAHLSTWSGLALSACWLFVRTGSYVRAFVLMHDATHGAPFSRRWLNHWTGIVTGLMVGMDAPDYQRTHAQHHALLGVEEESSRDPDLIVLWTTKDWAAWPRGLSKAAARVMCDPLILFSVMAPVWIVAFNVSWPHRVAHQSPRARVLYVLGKVAFLPCIYAAFMFVSGLPRAHLWGELLAQQIALSYAMFLYCVEHTFEGVYRVPKAEFDRTAAGLLGSSYLPMPWWWRWATIGVEFHHFHHLNARVPCYRMQECEDSAPPGLWEAAGVRRLTARDGFRCLVLSLWDPDKRCYVPFPEWAWLDRLLAGPDMHAE